MNMYFVCMKSVNWTEVSMKHKGTLLADDIDTYNA